MLERLLSLKGGESNLSESKIGAPYTCPKMQNGMLFILILVMKTK